MLCVNMIIIEALLKPSTYYYAYFGWGGSSAELKKEGNKMYQTPRWHTGCADTMINIALSNEDYTYQLEIIKFCSIASY